MGWVLKECSKNHPEEIHDFIMEHKRKMPRIPLRISLERYGQSQRKVAMAH